MKVVFHEFYYPVYSSDPAAESGRMESIVSELPPETEIVTPEPATEEQIVAAHSQGHVAYIRNSGLYDIAALAAGGALAAARIGLSEPSFAAIRPPGHHASRDASWGFCHFNNMAVALLTLKNEGLIDTALVLDFDLHYGDGTDNILAHREWVEIHNPAKHTREDYLEEVAEILSGDPVDIIGISAGFDNHVNDWGGLMYTRDYEQMGRMARDRAREWGAGCFAILEGGYNHNVLGKNVAALLEGLSGA